MTHQLDWLEANGAVVAAKDEPFVTVGGFTEMQLGTRFLFAEMRDAGDSQSLAPHKPVARAAGPTGLNRQASYAVTQADKWADDIRVAEAKAVGVFAFDGHRVISAVRLAGELDHRVENPTYALFADLVVAGL